jgi:uncharacterized protein YegL
MQDLVLPFYVLCDESYSMSDHMNALNAGLHELHRSVRTDPSVKDVVQICLIGFAENARVLVPLSPPGEFTEITRLSVRAATNFGHAFAVLRDTIELDIDRLRAQTRHVSQPTVFFLSDGQPTDPALWRDAYDRLVDPSWTDHPRIVAFGIGDADAGTIGTIGTARAYLAEDATTPATALRHFVETLSTSMVCVEPDDVALPLPRHVAGYTELVGHRSDHRSTSDPGSTHGVAARWSTTETAVTGPRPPRPGDGLP